MDTKEKSKKYFDAQAEDYDNSPAGKFVAPMYDEVLLRIEKSAAKSVLDIGCGSGNILGQLVGRNMSLFGLDLSDAMVQVAENRLGNRALVTVGDAEKLPYENSSMDLIVCNASFHHYPNPEKVLKEMYRVLKSDGSLLIGDPNLSFLLRVLMNPFIKYSNAGDYKIYSKSGFEKLLMANGFRMVDWSKPTNNTCVFEAKKLR